MDIHHDPTACEYTAAIDGHTAVLNYRSLDKAGRELDLWHIEVPPALRGTGASTRFACAVFDRLVAEGIRYRLSCSYLRGVFVPRHPQYAANVIS